MKSFFALFLCGILLSSAYTIGAPQSIPDSNSSLIPSAFAQTDISGTWTGTYEKFFVGSGYNCHWKGTAEANISQSGSSITATFNTPTTTVVSGDSNCSGSGIDSNKYPGDFEGTISGSNIPLEWYWYGAPFNKCPYCDQLDGTISSNQLRFEVTDDAIQAGSYMLFTSQTSGGSTSTDPDKDGLTGTADRCPDEFGPSKNGGCPYDVDDAEQYFNNNNYSKVAEITDEILKTKPREMRAVWLGGIAHYNLGDYDTSVNRFRTYTEIAPQDYAGYVELGKSFIALENYNEAINILGTGITLAPPDKLPPINNLLYYAQIDYFYQQGGKNVCHPAESIFNFSDTQTTTRTKSATDQIFYIISPNHDFSREYPDVMDVKAINGNDPSEVVQIQFIETGDNTGIFYSNITTYGEIFPITPDTIHFEFGNACTDLLKITIFISGILTVDSDGDGIFDNADSCINQKETFNNYQDRDGCPDSIPSDIDVIIQYNSSIPGCEENNSCYAPSSLNIDSGDTVTWYNDDDSAKNLSSGNNVDGPDGLFDSGMFMSKEKFEFTFDDAGTFDYYDKIHPWMQGKIVVKYVPLDSDEDGILNENDLCPDEPENFNNFEDNDGCPDATPAEQCIDKHFTDATLDDPQLIIDATLKTITCVKFTEKFSNPKVSLPLTILYFLLGTAYDDVGDSKQNISNAFGEAISYANKVLISEPNYSEIYYVIAYSYFKLENYANSLSAIDKAIALNPDDSNYQDFRNEILQFQEEVKASSYTVTKIGGEVTIIQDRIRNKNPTVNETILVENSIETLVGKIKFSNEKATFTLDEKTHIVITASDHIQKIIDLKKGKLYASIDKSLCEGKDCKIITPTSTQKITGTEFIIKYDERTKRTTVYLKAGSMEIFPNEGQSQSFSGPTLIRVDKSHITESKEMSDNYWGGEMSFTEFERKITEEEKDFDRWWYFENLDDCEDEKECNEENAIIQFLIPKSWRFDVLYDLLESDYYDDHDDYDDYDNSGYGNLDNFAAYGAVDDGYDDHDDGYGCDTDCQGLLVDPFKNSYESGEPFDSDSTDLLWIGDWVFGEDEFILVLLDQSSSFKSFEESQYFNYLENLSEYFCQDVDPIYDEECTITKSDDAEFVDLNHIPAYHQTHHVQFIEEDHDHDETINQVYRFTIVPNGDRIWTFFFASESVNDWAYAPQFEITENSIMFSSSGYGYDSGVPVPPEPVPPEPVPPEPVPPEPVPPEPVSSGKSITGIIKQKQTPQEIVKKVASKSSSGASFASKYLDKAEPVTKKKIPSWVKNNAKWWSEKQIDDKEFVGGIQHLVKQKIIAVPKDLVTKSKFIKFNAEEFTRPMTRGETVKVEISGKIENFEQNNSILLEIQDPNNKTTEQTLVGANGEYHTLLLLDTESPLGTWNVKVKFNGKIVDIGKFVLTSKLGDQNKIVEEKGIPDWLRNNAKWWSQGLISEDDFIKGIEYLIQNGILSVAVDEEKLVEEKPVEQKKAFSFKTKSLKLDKSTYKLPITRSMTTLVFITGTIDDYLSGSPIILELEKPDGSSTEQKIRGAGGAYNTQLAIDVDFPTGQYILKVTYREKIVDAIAFTVVK